MDPEQYRVDTLETLRRASEQRIEELRTRLRGELREEAELRIQRMRVRLDAEKEEVICRFNKSIANINRMRERGIPPRALEAYENSQRIQLERAVRFYDQLLEDFINFFNSLLA